MSTPPASETPLNKPVCAVCGKQDDLLQCSRCKVIRYCSKADQTENFGEHKAACREVKRTCLAMELWEANLRYARYPEDPFEEDVGRFGLCVSTRPYIRARHDHARAILKIATVDAVHLTLHHYLDLLRLSRYDAEFVRLEVPFVLLRLGCDQESCDFVKWWATIGQDPGHDLHDLSLPYLDIKNADAFEPVLTHFLKSYEVLIQTKARYDLLSQMTALTLVKIRLLLDLKALQSSWIVRDRVPREVFDGIRRQLVTNLVAKRVEVIAQTDLTDHVRQIEDQVLTLHSTVTKTNPFFWNMLLDCKTVPETPTGCFGGKSRAEVQLVLASSYDAWVETVGAFDMLSKLCAAGSFNDGSQCVLS